MFLCDSIVLNFGQDTLYLGGPELGAESADDQVKDLAFCLLCCCGF